MMKEENLENKRTDLSLSKKQIIVLGICYLIWFIVGVFLFISSVLFPNIYTSNTDILLFSFIGSVGSATLGSSIFYTRKLYKSLINGNLQMEPNEELEKLKLGTFMYLFARPFFSIGLALLILLAMIASTYMMFTTEVKLSTGFQYLAMFLSFFGGFSTGSFLPKLESKGDSIARNIFNEN